MKAIFVLQKTSPYSPVFTFKMGLVINVGFPFHSKHRQNNLIGSFYLRLKAQLFLPTYTTCVSITNN